MVQADTVFSFSVVRAWLLQWEDHMHGFVTAPQQSILHSATRTTVDTKHYTAHPPVVRQVKNEL